MLIEQLLPNCALHRQQPVSDSRGSLLALEGARSIPFEIARVYCLYNIMPGQERGFHAHRDLQQWVVCMAGNCTVLVDDSWAKREVRLDTPELALHVGPWVWREMRDFSPGAVLMVLASAIYDESDYIRSYEDFVAEVQAQAREAQ